MPRPVEICSRPAVFSFPKIWRMRTGLAPVLSEIISLVIFRSGFIMISIMVWIATVNCVFIFMLPGPLAPD